MLFEHHILYKSTWSMNTLAIIVYYTNPNSSNKNMIQLSHAMM